MSPARLGRGRILVAEDDPDLRRVAVRLLASSGYEAEGAEDGEAAWTALNRAPFELLVTDHGMPRLTGVELLKRLRTAHLELPVIIVSGSMPTEELDRHPWLRVNDRMLKPYSADELLRRVAAVLDPGARAPGFGAKLRNWLECPAPPAAPHR